AGTGIFILLYLAIVVVEIVAVWRLFTKAGRPGWASIIPIYNSYVLLKISGHSGWWLLLLCIPVLDVVLYIIWMIDLARSYGRGTGFGIGMLLLAPIFIPILAFSDSQYVGPNGAVARPALA
ncbi:MAG TPA: DUF5684 domain-containing protein, partial [Chloroflexota bacterium]|nr:DUF5684 domain-containing protein [Chloroflexota bacterium]